MANLSWLKLKKARGAAEFPRILSANTFSVSEGIGLRLHLIAHVPCTWAITGGADAASFSIDDQHLVLPAPATDGSYAVIVQATSVQSGRKADQAIAGAVIPLTITSSPTATGPQGTVLTGVLTANEPATWAKVGGAQAAAFDLDGDTWTLPADEASGSYAVVWQATSLDGLRVETQNFGATLAASGEVPGVVEISPGPLWDGSAKSGYAGYIPTNPARGSAQAILRETLPANRVITDDILFGVRGGASLGEELQDFSQILCHCEGNVYDVTTEIRTSLVDVNGVTQELTGNFVRLVAANFPATYGEINLYFEGIPSNPLVTKRVIGPFRFFHVDPASPKANKVVTFGSDAPNDTPADPLGPYKTLTAAAIYARNQQFLEPILQCVTTGDYDLGTLRVNGTGGTNLTGTRMVITAASGITCTIKRPSQDGGDGSIRPVYNGLEFRGSGVVWDQINTLTLWWETGENHAVGALGGAVPNQHHFNGCTITNSMGRWPLFRGYVPGYGISAGSAIYTFCTVSDIRADKSFQGGGLILNNTCARLPADVFAMATVAIGNRLNDCNATGYLSDHVSARIRYTGPGTGTVSRIKNPANLDPNYTGIGDALGLFTLTDTEGTNFSMQTNTSFTTLAAAVDALSGWEMVDNYPTGWTTQDDRSTQAVSIAGSGKQQAPFTRNLTSASGWLDLITNFDIHADAIQIIPPSVKSNCIFADNVGFNMSWQFTLLQSTAGVKAGIDFLIVNNCSHNDLTAFPTTLLAQISFWGVHLLLRHNTLINQNFAVRTIGGVKTTFDAYCEIYGNLFQGLDVGAGNNLTFAAKNHLINGPAGAGTKPNDFTSGGTMATLNVDAPHGDFTPAGLLLDADKLIASPVPFDALGNRRLALDARGAISIAT